VKGNLSRINHESETSNVTTVTEVRIASAGLVAGTWQIQSAVTTTDVTEGDCDDRLFVGCGIARFLCAKRVGPIRRSCNILIRCMATVVPNFGENRILKSLSHPAYLMRRQPKRHAALRNKLNLTE